jgi:RimJ/RimL family protein N-acetyltransferase
MPFAVAWSDAAGSPSFREDFVAFHERAVMEWSPERWSLILGVWLGRELVGCQDVGAEQFASNRTVASGSWLGERFQGHGYGTEMRAGMLELAFTGLGAVAALSGALDGNVRSARISARLGYEPDGETFVSPRGVPVREQRLRLTRERWAEFRTIEATLAGVEPCLALFGAA